MTPASPPARRGEGLYPRPQLLASALRSNAFRTSIEGRSEIRADPRCERGLAAGVETLPDTSFLARAAATVSPRHSDAASETGCRFLFKADRAARSGTAPGCLRNGADSRDLSPRSCS